MKYIINLIVVFDPLHRTLALNNSSQATLELSKPSCRVLNEFIKNNGVDLSRDTLLKNVWEDFGFTPSSASLSNHISELRKSFVDLGIDKPIIITLPRVGFKMEADIHPIPDHETDISEEKAEVAELESEKNETAIEETCPATPRICNPIITKHKPWMKYILALIAGLATVGVALLRWTPSTQLELIGTYKQCTIYSIKKDPLPGSEAKATNLLLSNKIDCEQSKQDIYYTEERPDNDLLKISFMAACKENQAGGNYQYCRTFKFVE